MMRPWCVVIEQNGTGVYCHYIAQCTVEDSVFAWGASAKYLWDAVPAATERQQPARRHQQDAARDLQQQARGQVVALHARELAGVRLHGVRHLVAVDRGALQRGPEPQRPDRALEPDQLGDLVAVHEHLAQAGHVGGHGGDQRQVHRRAAAAQAAHQHLVVAQHQQQRRPACRAAERRRAQPRRARQCRRKAHGRRKPASRSNRAVAINGSPISAVGSLDSIASNRLMPRPSALKLPAQSSGCSAVT